MYLISCTMFHTYSYIIYHDHVIYHIDHLDVFHLPFHHFQTNTFWANNDTPRRYKGSAMGTACCWLIRQTSVVFRFTASLKPREIVWGHPLPGAPHWDHRCLSWSSFLKQVVELKEFFSCDSWRFESKCRGYEVEDLESMNNSKSANFVIFSSEISLDSWLKREAKHHLQVEIAELLLLRLTRCWKWQGALDSSTSDTPPWNKHRNPKKWWVSKTRISFLKKQILLHPRRHGSYKSPT